MGVGGRKDKEKENVHKVQQINMVPQTHVRRAKRKPIQKDHSKENQAALRKLSHTSKHVYKTSLTLKPYAWLLRSNLPANPWDILPSKVTNTEMIQDIVTHIAGQGDHHSL